MPTLFYAILANTLVASLTNTFVWFALIFWVYLQTQSVLVTSVMAGLYLVSTAGSGFFLGVLVDRYPKKRVMLLSSLCSFGFYLFAGGLLLTTSLNTFTHLTSPHLWGLILLILLGAIAGNLRLIALPTLVTLLIPEAQRDQANGLVGTTNGVAFLVASAFSGLVIGFLGMVWVIGFALGLTFLSLLHLMSLSMREQPIPPETHQNPIDLPGTIRVIRLVPGLFALIFFNTFNNFLGGVFTSLMDAYGLLQVPVQAWGVLWSCLSLGFIVGGLIVAKQGVGKHPLRTLFLANVVIWTVASLFTIQKSIPLLAIGLFTYLCLVPFIEAAEQTILQALVPYERQGRVFGFAHSIEQAASPLTAFMVGPIAQYIFIPFMTTGAGIHLLGPWFGTGKDRGIALLFTVTGLVGLGVTLMAMRSRPYRKLSALYQRR